ncbi:MAG: DUF6089 family protein [Bacteroidales bacterium]|nr:DUF6089 family protein [Bacteroidales bacterium]MCF8404414.1 DUF6089 family protein [Bacteroidales bacterium]
MKNILLLTGIILFGLSCQAQLEAGVFGGGTFYMGDINPSTPFMQTNVAYGVLARYNINPRWAGRVNLYQGVITGDDKIAGFLPDRSLDFKSGITELAGVMEFHFLPYYNGSLKNYWTPYIFAGAALLYQRPQRDERDLRDFGTEGQQLATYINEVRKEYSYFVLSIPFGVGVKYSFSEKIAATVEWGMRKAYSDYLDDISTTYYIDARNLEPGDPDYNTIVYSDPNLDHDALMQRGNSKTNDWYSFAGITLTYYIDMTNRNKCSSFQEKYQ